MFCHVPVQGPWNRKVRLIYKHLFYFIFVIYHAAAAAAAKLPQSCPTPCDPIDGSPPASPVPRILQARTLEWVAISFSNAWKWKVKGKSLSRVQLLVTPCTAAHQAPLSMGFSRQEYWSGVPLPSLQKSISCLLAMWLAVCYVLGVMHRTWHWPCPVELNCLHMRK